MAATPTDVRWHLEDGVEHNFSPACLEHAKGLYVLAAPGLRLPGWGMDDADMMHRMMALTSWLDLLSTCRVRHVLVLMAPEELQRRYAGLGDGSLEATCEGQGIPPAAQR
ncbi:unnamed protein product [Prorocentrum cordatum]|uniref:Uncharacterized protein n=1 Tax=Prorocentrum cordatum TaxID=2364126 RepID=A0ABN9SXQ9_9DINO|nr:unnamed protein product [Polarella glacialis]